MIISLTFSYRRDGSGTDYSYRGRVVGGGRIRGCGVVSQGFVAGVLLFQRESPGGGGGLWLRIDAGVSEDPGITSRAHSCYYVPTRDCYSSRFK